MKNFSLLIVLLATSLLTKGMETPAKNNFKDGFKIIGKITGKADGKKVYLKSADKKLIIDSTIIKNSSFVFLGKVEVPEMYNIIIKKNDTAAQRGRPIYQPIVPVFIENGTINISANLDELSEEDFMYKGGYKYDKVNISGSKSNESYLKFLEGYEPLAKKRSTMFMDEYIKYLNPGKDKVKGPLSEGVGIVTRLDEAASDRDGFIKNFVSANPANPVILYVLDQYLGSFSVTEIDKLTGSVSTYLLNTANGKALINKAKEVKKTASGAMYADFDFKDNFGNDKKLSDYLGKGKYVLLEFWASWCGPCRADIPHLKEAYEIYNPAGFEVISVSMDDDKEKWLKAIDDEQMKWMQVTDLKAFEGTLNKLYNFQGIPTCLLIAPDGKIVTRNMRGSWMDKKLIELYGNKFGDKF